MNIFNKLFIIDDIDLDSYHYKFFYYMPSSRGNMKLGITENLWQRLRLFQQGTDECLRFSDVWIAKTHYEDNFKYIEKQIKYVYSKQCLFDDTDRAGHTEWFKNIPLEDFQERLETMFRALDVDFCKIPLEEYTATKRSHCPFDTPHSYDLWWFENFFNQTKLRIKN